MFRRKKDVDFVVMLKNVGVVIVMWDHVVQTQQILHESKTISYMGKVSMLDGWEPQRDAHVRRFPLALDTLSMWNVRVLESFA